MELENAERAVTLQRFIKSFQRVIDRLEYLKSRFDNKDADVDIRGEHFFVMNRELFVDGLIAGYRDAIDRAKKDLSEL